MFGTIFNDALVAVMKRGGGSRSNPAEMLEVESFSQRLQQCIRKKDDELAEEKALLGETVNPRQDEEDVEVTTRTVRERIPGVYGRDGSSDFGDLCVLPAGSRHNQLFGEANQRQPPWQDKHPGPVWEAQHR